MSLFREIRPQWAKCISIQQLVVTVERCEGFFFTMWKLLINQYHIFYSHSHRLKPALKSECLEICIYFAYQKTKEESGFYAQNYGYMLI